MKPATHFPRTLLICASACLITTCTAKKEATSMTEITRWPDGKRGAVSLTYDDGSINQFRKALPIMNSLEMPGTFYINTGMIPGSQFQGRFIGRPTEAIIESTAAEPTNKDNFYERASAAGYLGYKGGLDYHNRAGSRIDAGDPEEAYRIIDELYEKIRNGELPPGEDHYAALDGSGIVTWDEIRKFVSQGHEFASHMVTHPRMAALDEVNMLYELEKSRLEILNQLGEKYTFSAECPYGTENERVMEYAHKVYPALRNRMPEPYMEELNRSSSEQPGSFQKEYVQWQRGATTRTPLPLMKSWVDTTVSNENIWLVLVFHGVDGVGWEALTSEMLGDYFRYIKSHDDLWVATFADATKYIRQRMNSSVTTLVKDGTIYVTLTGSLDREMYDLPLTLKTYLVEGWDDVEVKQGNEVKRVRARQDPGGYYVIYQASPDMGIIELSGV